MLTITVRRTLLALLALVVFPGLGRADDPKWADKMFSELSYDFGYVARGADVRHTVTVTNIYQEQVHIAGVKTTCGCSAVTPSKTTLNSRETAELEVTIDTRRFMRKKDPTIIVTFDAPLYAEVRIPMQVYIRTDVVLTPGAVNFGTIDQGAGGEREVDIEYAGRADWTIRSVETNNKYLQASVKELARSPEIVKYKLNVKLDPSAPEGPLNQQIMLVTDDATANPRVPVLVQARIEPDVSIVPKVLAFGMLTPGQPKTQNLVIRGKQPIKIESVECASDRELFAVRLPDTARPVQVLPITINPPKDPGKVTEQFMITIEGRPEPLTFEAFGTVAAPAAAAAKE